MRKTLSIRSALCTGSLLAASAALLTALISGCGNNAVTPLEPDSEVPQQDLGPAPQPKPEGPWGFVAEPAAGAASAALQLESLEGDRAWLRLVVKGVPKLQGIAFRVGFDPARVKVLRSEQGPAWTTGTWFPNVARFTPRAEGELWGGIGFVGAHELDATKETVVARIQVELAGADPIPLSFKLRRNLIIDASNASVEVSWVGGTFRRSAS